MHVVIRTWAKTNEGLMTFLNRLFLRLAYDKMNLKKEDENLYL